MGLLWGCCGYLVLFWGRYWSSEICCGLLRLFGLFGLSWLLEFWDFLWAIKDSRVIRVVIEILELLWVIKVVRVIGSGVILG